MRDGINILAASGVKRSALDESILTRRLTEDQRDAAWEVGRRKYEARLKHAKQQVKEGVEDIRPARVRYDSTIIDGREYSGVSSAGKGFRQSETPVNKLPANDPEGPANLKQLDDGVTGNSQVKSLDNFS